MTFRETVEILNHIILCFISSQISFKVSVCSTPVRKVSCVHLQAPCLYLSLCLQADVVVPAPCCGDEGCWGQRSRRTAWAGCCILVEQREAETEMECYRAEGGESFREALDVSLYLWSSAHHRIVDVCDGLQEVERYESYFVKLITTLPPAFR